MNDCAGRLQLLDRESILQAMTAAARAQVHSLSIALETTSTQADALATPPPSEGCAIFLAEQQTAGQGRRGRPWISPPAANLYLSVSRRFAGELSALSGLSLAVGVATAEALNVFIETSETSGPRIGVKWPNDLLAGGDKLGGILVQLRGDGEAGALAVIGIGINVRMPPAQAAQIDQAWCDLAGLGAGDGSRDALAAALLDHLLPALTQFDAHGLSPFLPRWRQLDALAGQPVRILDGPRSHEGIAAGITESGALRLRQHGDELAFHSGEVSVRPA